MRYLLLSIVILLSCSAFSQINFQDISFADALAKAKQEEKLVFIQFESDECEQCNDVANKGLDNKDVQEKIDQNFIPIRISITHPDRETISNMYGMKGFGSLFVDADKTLLHSYPGTTSFYKEYLNQIDIALSKRGEILKLDQMEQMYKTNKTYGILELLIQKRKALYLSYDRYLDEYVSILPADSINSSSVLLFLMNMAPVLGSKADSFLHKDSEIFNQLWYSTLPLQKRAAINTSIIYRSMTKAIEQKNESYATRVAYFAMITHGSNRIAADKSYKANLLRYYREIKDSTRYLRTAIPYYTQYLMTIKVDSIKAIDEMTRQKLFTTAPLRDTTLPGNKTASVKTISFAPIVQNYSRWLNEGAWTFYKMTNDQGMLSYALQWSKRALEFFETPEVMDTYARLLYKTGKKDEAILEEEKATALKEKYHYPTASYEEVIRKMKNGETLN